MTDGYTITTQRTGGAWQATCLIQLVTNSPASITADAFHRIKGNTLLILKRLGILAPETAERTAHQKKSGAYSGPIVDGVAFNIEN